MSLKRIALSLLQDWSIRKLFTLFIPSFSLLEVCMKVLVLEWSNQHFQPIWVVIQTMFSPLLITATLESSTLKWAIVIHLCSHCFAVLQDFAIGLSILLKGSIEDKLKWIFSVYDVNKDGVLSKTELKDLTTSVNKIVLDDLRVRRQPTPLVHNFLISMI